MKKHIHIHSDCFIFGGCENMLVNLFNSEIFMGTYNVSFSYRFSPVYEKGFRQQVQKDFRTMPLKLLDINNIMVWANTLSSKVIGLSVKLFATLILKYLFIFWNMFVLFNLLKKEKVDILHINNGGYPGASSCTSVVLAAKLVGIKNIVYVVNNVAVPYKSPLRWLDYPLDRVIARSVNYFITGSIFAGIQLKTVLKLPDNNVLNYHNGIAPRSITEVRQQVTERLGIDSERVLIVVVAILEKRKGHIYLLEAMKQLKYTDRIKDLPILAIEGVGDQINILKDYVKKVGLVEDVIFIEQETNICNLLNAADMFILPSIYQEDFPNVILEAMSLGKPVIATTISGIPEQIDHMKTGILVNPKDSKELVSAISLLLRNPTLRKNMGKNAQIKFQNMFTERISVDRYLKLYRQLLEEEY